MTRQASSLDEALDRVKIFADEGADVLFIDALTSISEMRSFANVCSEIPHMTNMLEGGGKTPICEIWELSEMGFNIVAFPLSLLSVSVSAMEVRKQVPFGTRNKTKDLIEYEVLVSPGHTP